MGAPTEASNQTPSNTHLSSKRVRGRSNEMNDGYWSAMSTKDVQCQVKKFAAVKTQDKIPLAAVAKT
ncbi:hypothetical protein RND71_036819 [Anisodus tanguticus]|uniref:Uncharacterized protein n=1 Tax=Anisodus tanguticus TaxID=243964 RepID=A0AAE1R1V9_9SOLA|nr:hypothetical protein RND71_036819 [Anisodus tanguticus]